MDAFSDKYAAFLADFGRGRKMVLSTACDNAVSSRMMSVVQLDGVFYFQTDVTFRKYRQLVGNPNVALCIDNIQIEGVSEELGRPTDDAQFCELFRECFRGSYDAYTALKNERLFAVRPTYIERWIYDGGIPYIECFDIAAERYEISRYIGV